MAHSAWPFGLELRVERSSWPRGRGTIQLLIDVKVEVSTEVETKTMSEVRCEPDEVENIIC